MREDRLQLAMERIHSDPALTGDLMDQEALVLLEWAESQVVKLLEEAAELPEEAAWEQLAPQLRALRQQMRHISKVSAAQPDPLVALKSLIGTAEGCEACSAQKKSE